MYHAILGYLLLGALIFLLLKGKAIPVVLFVLLPIIVAVFAGYNLTTINDYIKKGVGTTTSNAILFCFSILFFNMMNEAGVFTPVVNAVMKVAGQSVTGICLAAVLVAVITHLDGSSTTTILITIPFLAPIFRKLKLNPCLLVLLSGTAMGVMNLSPWAGAINRVAVVTNLEASYLWHRILPMQGVGLLCTAAMAVLYSRRAIKTGAGLAPEETITIQNDEVKPLTWKFYFNLVLTVATIAVLIILPQIQAYTVFMVAVVLAVLVNYGDQKNQTKAVNKFSPAAFFMAITMISSGVFVGILSNGEPSILSDMAGILLNILPAPLAKHLHLIMAFLSSPLGLVFSGDSYLYGVLPLCVEVGAKYGISGEAMGLCMVIGKNVAMIGSPIFASTYLAISMAGVELKDYLKYAFLPMWIVSIIMVVSGLLFGIIPL
jgi:CitMHS family citrate-Mg2+:H+ or citrate-Ca2+:H+ symporter